MMNLRRNMMGLFLVVIVLLAGVLPVAAQDGVVPLEVVQSDWYFWIGLVGVGAIFLMLAIGLSVGLSTYLNKLANQIPDFVKPYLAPTVDQLYAGYDSGVLWARERAAHTATPVDDEIVELVAADGRKVLVKVVSVLTAEAEAEADGV